MVLQLHFDLCVFQNLNFSVFNETENCQLVIFRFLVEKKNNNNFAAVTCTFINNSSISISKKENKSPV